MIKNQVIEQIGSYRILKSHPIGSGATGCVYYGQNKDGLKVAVKSMPINKITQSIQKQIQNQIKNLTALSSPFIVKLYEYFRCKDDIFMVLEFCEDGDLKHYLHNRQNQGISENEAVTFMRHVMHGYKALYQAHIIHRDIKPANILLKQGVAKLGDFGFSRVVDDPDKTQKLTLLGTPLYTAPQILQNHAFSNKCDVWSMGVVFYEMLHGRTPWTGVDLQSLKVNILKKKLEFKPNLTKQIQDILNKMLAIPTQQRASCQMLFSHPLFAKPVQVKLKKEVTFQQAKQILQEYLKNYLVKSYLLISMEAQVTFAPNQQPLGNTGKSQQTIAVEKQTKVLTKRRNFAFLHLNVSLMPQGVNTYMQLQYSLIKRAYDIIGQIGQDFQTNNKLGQPKWLYFRRTPQYKQLNLLLANDYKLLSLLVKSCQNQIGQRIANRKLPPQTTQVMKKFDKKFDKIFQDAMEKNSKQLKQSKKGVCWLIQDYLIKYCLEPKQVIQNQLLDFASFYEERQKEYGLC